MIPEIGTFALILALCLALAQAVLALGGAARGDAAWMAAVRPAVAGQLAFLILAYVCLSYSFLVDDFSVRYVANNSNSMLPWVYKLSAVWGGHEGSMLLWVTVLGLWTLAVATFSNSLPAAYSARVLGVMGLISVGFLLFTLLTSNPFARLVPPASDGQDLNPLLQDPAMAAHPPLLYVGYVGFSVVFSFAVAAMLGGRLDAAWARWSRPWTVVAWLFLTIGIALGSWWAYYELGWGGWWFWDPVENASFMPWLMGTALIHSLAVTEKRGAFKAWTVLLAIGAFSLSLLGTFLVRSGVLTSVHSFASDPTRGVFILAFLAVVAGGSLTLYAWRAPTIRSGGEINLLSREGMLLANNVLLVVACASVLLGTLYPLIVEALDAGKISVGPPYFNTVFVPLMLLLAVFLGIGPLASWRRASARDLARRLRPAALVGLAGIALGAAGLGGVGPVMVVGLFMAGWIVGSVATVVYQRLRNRGGLRGLTAIPRGFYGMNLAHLGVAVFILGAGVVSGYETERNIRMTPGETANVAGYAFSFEDLRDVQGPNYLAEEGRFEVARNGEHVVTMRPQKRRYEVRRQSMTEAAIDPGVTRDLFVALGEPLEGDAWSVRIHHKPLVQWIWGGALMMAIGGLLAASDRRYRLAGRDDGETAEGGRSS